MRLDRKQSAQFEDLARTLDLRRRLKVDRKVHQAGVEALRRDQRDALHAAAVRRGLARDGRFEVARRCDEFEAGVAHGLEQRQWRMPARRAHAANERHARLVQEVHRFLDRPAAIARAAICEFEHRLHPARHMMQSVQPDLGTLPSAQHRAKRFVAIETERSARMDVDHAHAVSHDRNPRQPSPRRIRIARPPIGRREQRHAQLRMPLLKPPHMPERLGRRRRRMHVVNGETDGGALRIGKPVHARCCDAAYCATTSSGAPMTRTRPASSHSMRCDIAVRRCTSCETTTNVTPRARNSSILAVQRLWNSASPTPSASSMRRMSASTLVVTANASRAIMPAEYVRSGASKKRPMSANAAMLSMRARIWARLMPRNAPRRIAFSLPVRSG